jgi:hypothetical protein
LKPVLPNNFLDRRQRAEKARHRPDQPGGADEEVSGGVKQAGVMDFADVI